MCMPVVFYGNLEVFFAAKFLPVVAEPDSACAEQTVPEMRDQQIEALPVIACMPGIRGCNTLPYSNGSELHKAVIRITYL